MLIGSMRFKRMRTRWQGHELLMLIILLMLHYGILPTQMPLGQVSATKNEEAFQQGIIERPICDQKLKTKYCNAFQNFCCLFSKQKTSIEIWFSVFGSFSH